MSLGLLFPLGLAALAAWLLPLLLHLVRREQQQPTEFAALRWLQAKLKPRRRLRFEQPLLLALRLLLLAALALLLAKPVLFGAAGDAPWLLVAPGADVSAAPALPEGSQRRWLAPGFPPLDAPAPPGPVATSSLLRQIDAELPAATPLTVLVTDTLHGADGERPRLARQVDWRIVAAAPSAVAPMPPGNTLPTLVIRHAPAQAAGARYLRAAALAWRAGDGGGGHRGGEGAGENAAPIDIADTAAALADGTRTLAWLAPGELPAAVQAWARGGGTLLLAAEATWPLPAPGAVAWRDARGEALAQAAAFGRGRVLQLRRPLAPGALPELLDPGFPTRLRELLVAPPPPPDTADARAHAPLPGGPGFPETPREFETPLLWLVLVLFALERLWATRRRPGGAP